MHPEQRKLFEAEFSITHRDGKMFIENVPIEADASVEYGTCEID